VLALPASAAQERRVAPAPRGTIAFLSDRSPNRGGEIYSVGLRGSRRTLSRSPLVADYALTLSPDGHRVAFVSNRDGTNALWVARVSGRGLARLGSVGGLSVPSEVWMSWARTGRLAYSADSLGVWVVGPAPGKPLRLARRGFYPEISPAGDRIAYEYGDTYAETFKLFIVSPRGRLLWSRGGHSPRWSPDGRRLAYVTPRGRVAIATPGGRILRQIGRAVDSFGWLPGGRHLYIEGPGSWIVSATGRVVFTVPGDDVLWSRDGRRLAYTTGAGVFVAGVRGEGRRRIARSTQGVLMDWSPDGRWIVAGAVGSRLVALGTDGQRARTIAVEPPGSTMRAYWVAGSRLVYESLGPFRADVYLRSPTGVERRLTSGLQRHAAPAWAPDGTRLAVSSSSLGCNRDCPSEIYAVDASNGRATRITTQPRGDDRQFAEAPAWSPDGRRVAFVRTGPPGTSIRVVAAEGGGERDLIERGSWPAWSPDGRRLAYLAGGVFVANADGTASRKIAPTAAGALTWSPDGERIAWREAATIKSVAADGSRPAQIAIRISPCDRLAPGSAGLAWSRDGRRFIFGGCGRAGPALANLDLWSVRTDGTGLRRLTRSLAPDWWPALR